MVFGIEIVVLVVLLLLSGFFSGAEVALVSLSRANTLNLIEKKIMGYKYIKLLKDDPQRMLSTILIGNNIVNVGASAITTSIMLQLFDSFAIGISTGVMTLLILIFGEITPKSIAAQHNLVVSQLVAGPIWVLSLVLAPILNVLDHLLNGIMRLIGINSKENSVTEDEIKSMIVVAQEEGAIKEFEKDLLHNIFEFDDMNVSEIMTPRNDMISIENKSNIGDVFNLINKKKFSRIPVFKNNNENFVGTVYVKDIIKYTSMKNRKINVAKVMKKPFFVPENKKISKLLRDFQKRNEQMAIVVNEHGSVNGLVTLEDVLEEIVGEIMDETENTDPRIKKIKTNEWIVNGRTEIEELNKVFKLDIKKKNFDTLSGFIHRKSGKLNKKGDVIPYNKYKFRVMELDGHRISKVKVLKVKK